MLLCVYHYIQLSPLIMIQDQLTSSNSYIISSRDSIQRNSIPNALLAARPTQQIRVGQPSGSAFPPPEKNFYTFLPTCLWQAVSKPAIVYNIVSGKNHNKVGLLQFFQYCRTKGEVTCLTIHLALVCLCLVFQIRLRYSTYTHYRENYPDLQYKVWSRQKRRWQYINYEQLQAGHIIIVERYDANSPKLTPADILPLRVASGKKDFMLKTTRIDKQQKQRRIKILRPLRKQVTLSYGEQLVVNQTLDQAQINYSFRSHLGSTFQATLILPQKDFITFSDANTIPRNVPISSQDYIVGVILLPSQVYRGRSMKELLSSHNRISDVLSKYLLLMVVMILLCSGVILLIDLILAAYLNSKIGGVGNYLQFVFCGSVNLLAIFSNTVYISVFIFIYIARLIDSHTMAKQYNFTLRNQIKSLDELAQTNTLVMNDYFFLQRKSYSEDFRQVFNPQAPLHQHFGLVFKLIQESPLMRQHLSGHTIPISKHFRQHPRMQSDSRLKVKILNQSLVSTRTVQMIVRVQMMVRVQKQLRRRGQQARYFKIRFKDDMVKSTINRLNDPQLLNQLKKISQGSSILSAQGEDTSKQLLFIEIIPKSLDSIQSSNQAYIFYGAVAFKEQFAARDLAIVTNPGLLQRYTMIILSHRPYQYLYQYLKRAGMFRSHDKYIIMEQKQQQEMMSIMSRCISEYVPQNQPVRKQVLLFLSASMITHLSRKNIRRGLMRLAKCCKYIFFYNCSQFQQQLCAVNLFKMFPQHIFLSNYSCDSTIFGYSNFSLAQRGSSAQMMATATIDKNKDLGDQVLREAVNSIQIVNCIVHSHAFKNQLFIAGNALLYLLVFRGNFIFMGFPYLQQFYIFYNFIFTPIPLVYLMIKRPTLNPNQQTKKYVSPPQIVMMNMCSLVYALALSYLSYSFVSQQFVSNVFTSWILVAIFNSNFFLLCLDGSQSKIGHIIAIVVQTVGAMLFVILVQLFSSSFHFTKFITNFDTQLKWFYLSNFLIMPLLSVLLLYLFAIVRQVNSGSEFEEDESGSEEKPSQQVFNIKRSMGKQMQSYFEVHSQED